MPHDRRLVNYQPVHCTRRAPDVVRTGCADLVSEETLRWSDGRDCPMRARAEPWVDFRTADAAELPTSDESFDLVLAFTLFTSIPDASKRAAVAREVQRVLRPRGALLWYDFWVNPLNPDTQALGPADIKRLFGYEPVESRRVTLAPPIVRAIAPRSWIACELLGRLPFLRTHWLALVRP